VARTALLGRDLLFGSRLQGDLAAAGVELELLSSPAQAAAFGGQDVLIVDLTGGDFDPAQVQRTLAAPAPLTLAFYSHVDDAVRTAALAAGFQRVVPRSRMAREAAALVADLRGA